MAAQPNPSSIPGGIRPELWDLLSDDQQIQIIEGRIPAEFFAENTATFDLSLIEQGGIPARLNENGRALWTLIESDQKGLFGLEIIANASNTFEGKSTFISVVDYLNSISPDLATIINDAGSISLNGTINQ